VGRNSYSVPSRLIGERVEVRVFMEHLEVWYAQRLIERLPRLRGRDRSAINYRHVIDWLVRKPGAFAQYRYRQELFPSSHFRLAYDALVEQQGGGGGIGSICGSCTWPRGTTRRRWRRRCDCCCTASSG